MASFNFALNIASTSTQGIAQSSSGAQPFGLPPATEPILSSFNLSDAFDDGEANLFAALRWDYGLSEKLYGRDTDIEKILAWACSNNKAATIRLVTGKGGAGKTRLAAEVAKRLKADGWVAGFLPNGDAVQFQSDKGFFLIYDYPEEKPERTKQLFAKITELRATDVPVRVLLLSRRDFNSWQDEALTLEGRFGKHAIAAPGPLAPSDASALIEEVAARFAKSAGKTCPDLSQAAEWLAKDATHRLPLFASAAAIHAVLAPHEPFGLAGAELMYDLARRELRRVRSASSALGMGDYGLERLLALGILADGMSEKTVTALKESEALSGARPDFPDRLKRSPWWRNGRLIRLEPDRPAAAFLDVSLFDRRREPKGDERLPDWLFFALEDRAAGFGDRLGRILYDLASLNDHELSTHPLNTRLVDMITRRPERTFVFEAIAEREVPHWAAPFAAAVARTVAEASPKESPKRAGSLNNAATYMSQCGQREEALATIKEAVALYRNLAAEQPESFTPDLAGCLNNLAKMLSDLGRREEALAASEKAVALYRRLAAARPADFTPNLAMSLNNLAKMLSDLGRREEALAASEEAVALRRNLAAARPEAFTPDLAMSLNNLATMLSALGRREEALAASEEAVALRRDLAAARPEAFTPDLASSLNNLANVLSDLGRREEALAVSEEAVALYRDLAAARPEAFTPNLAISINNLANRLSELGRREEALAASEEAVALYRDLAAAWPQAFTPDLVGSLGNMARILSNLGREEEARAAAKEAGDLRRTIRK